MSNNWTAIYAPDPRGKGGLKVSGECTSVGGETFTLKRHHGHANKGTLVLDKTTKVPGGSVRSDLARTVTVTYEEQVDEDSYLRVQILPDGVEVPVEQVSAATPNASSARAGT